LFSADRLVANLSHRAGIEPSRRQSAQGDRRTPEGDFYIFTRNDKSAYYLSLGISYPNAAHAERGLRDGLITKGQYDAIMRALAQRKLRRRIPASGGETTSRQRLGNLIGPGLCGVGERRDARVIQSGAMSAPQ